MRVVLTGAGTSALGPWGPGASRVGPASASASPSSVLLVWELTPSCPSEESSALEPPRCALARFEPSLGRGTPLLVTPAPFWHHARLAFGAAQNQLDVLSELWTEIPVRRERPRQVAQLITGGESTEGNGDWEPGDSLRRMAGRVLTQEPPFLQPAQRGGSR